jgi:hypothetical protein
MVWVNDTMTVSRSLVSALPDYDVRYMGIFTFSTALFFEDGWRTGFESSAAEEKLSAYSLSAGIGTLSPG